MRSIESTLCGDTWRLTASDGRSWPAHVPGCAHLDLMRAGEIPDPDSPGGEAAQEWIGRTEFRWSREISLTAQMLAHTHIELVFESIDTVAEVRLDGKVILRTANEFHPHRVEIGSFARTGDPLRTMLLEVLCAGPVSEVERLQTQLGSRPVNGDWTPYPFLRKTACQFGWDWGPRVASSGIVGIVMLHAWTGLRLDSVRPLTRSCTKDEAILDVFVDAVCDGDPTRYEARIEIESPDGRAFDAVVTFKRSTRDLSVIAHAVIIVPRPMRWWPRGYGAQHIHRMRVELTQQSATISSWSGRIGLRCVALDTTPEVDGTRFAIRVNDQTIWCAGANWIPEGLFRSNETNARERLLQACEANLVMLRVWGGGGYESQSWYELCDQLGILVWQDFAFACATYPEDDPFPALVEAEARYQVARLSSHPSVVLWCGGNEDILAWHSWGFRDRLRPGQTWGRRYWLEILPRICAELDPSRPYWPESPWSGSLELDPNDSNRGDRHIWDATAKVEGLRSITPRFASEFGHQSPPALRSLAKALDIDEETLASMTAADGCALITDRQRATGGDTPQYGEFLSSRFDPATDFASWIVQAQIVQAKAMRIAYSWYRTNRPRCSGALVWQMNDAWTGHSWSLVDAQGRAKPAWHAVRESCAPRMLTIHQRDGAWVVDAVNDSPIAWKSRVCLLKCANVERTDSSTDLREYFLEGFTVEPWQTITALHIPQEFLPDHTSILFAEAPTEFRADPIAIAWASGAHERDLRTPTGESFIPKASIEWKERLGFDGNALASATVVVNALSPIVDALLVPRGDWVSVTPMLISLPPGESQNIEIVWRTDSASSSSGKPRTKNYRVDLFASGRSVALLNSSDVT